MINEKWKTQSKQASKIGVCHTHEECQLMYNELTDKEKKPVLEFLKELLSKDNKFIKDAISKDRKYWISNHHHGWGTYVRNSLRSNEFNEDYFNVDNLDCIYVQLIEESLK